MYNKEQIKRVFYHELGHYFAFKLGSKHIPNFEIENILIYPCKENNDYLCGEITPKVPKEYQSNSIEKNRLSHYLCNQFYGCIFQIRFYHEENKFELKDCMQKYGNNDLFNAKIEISRHRHKFDDIYQIFNNHLLLLKREQLINIENLFDNHHHKLFIQKDNKLSIDIEYLDKITTYILDEFTIFYNTLINELNLELST